MMAFMRIMGIDPGLASVGYGLIDHDGTRSHLLASGCISTRPGELLPVRLRTIHDALVALIEEWHPQVASIEQLFFCTNVRTAIAVAQARGVCLLATARAGLEIAEYTPLQVKQGVVGYGKASKLQVEKMVKAILGMQELPQTSHAADALALALCHAHTQKYVKVEVAVDDRKDGWNLERYRSAMRSSRRRR